jgi:hypothetical protein
MDTYVTTVGGGNNSISGRGLVRSNADGSLVAPETVLMTVSAARTYYVQYRQAHVPRIILMAAVEGCLQGNPPYNPARIAEAGLSHIANVNTLDMKAIYERSALSFWNLFNQTENLVVFEIRQLNVLGQDHDYKGWADILGQTFTKVVKEDWEDFTTMTNQLTGQLIKFGASPLIWPDEDDFRWEVVDLSRFYCADKAPVATSKWDCVCVETLFSISYLWGVYQALKGRGEEEGEGELDDEETDGEGETDSPEETEDGYTGKEVEEDDQYWDIEQLEMFLLQRANLANKNLNSGGNSFSNMMEVQRAMQEQSFNVATMFTDNVTLVSIFYKEFSGKISHKIFDPVNSGSGDSFLYNAIDKYDSFSEAIVIFTYSPEEPHIHGNKGVGHKIYPIGQAMMQLDCTLLDACKMASTVFMSTNSTPGRNMEPVRVISGVVTDIGQAQVQPNPMQGNTGLIIQAANYFEGKVNRNAMISGDDPSAPDSDRGSKSAPEAQMQSYKEFGIGKQNVAHFYNTFDIVIRGMVAKLLRTPEGHIAYPFLERWKELAMQRGVPEEVFEVRDALPGKLPKHLSARAARVAGDGSHLGLIMGLGGVGAIAGGFTEEGQYNYKKDIITSRLGQDYVTRYIGDDPVMNENGSGASVAQLENLMMQDGKNPLASRDNPHKTHIGSHFALGNQLIQSVSSQQMDAISADKVFSVFIPHVGEHIAFVAEDPLNAGFLEQIKGPWNQMQKFAQLNRVRAQNQQRSEMERRQGEEEQMNADMMEQQRKDAVAEREQARKDFEASSKMARAEEQAQLKGEIMRRGVEIKGEVGKEAVRLKAANEADMNRLKKPQEVLSGTSTEEIQQQLIGQVGKTPNPTDFV